MDETRVYVAAPAPSVERARSVAGAIAGEGGIIVSTWHEGEGPVSDDGLTVDAARVIAARNLAQIHAADVMVVLTDDRHGRETFVEVGVAIAEEIPIVWSLERGGACLSIWRESVIPVRKDEAILDSIDLALRSVGRSSGEQLALGAVS